MDYGPLSFDTRYMLTADLVWNSPKFSNPALGQGYRLFARMGTVSRSASHTLRNRLVGYSSSR